MAKLNTDWPTEKQEVCLKSKLDEWFLRSKSQPPCWGLPFFPDLHSEVSRSENKPFSACVFGPSLSNYSIIMGLNEHRYGAMPRVEEMLASYLSLEPASSLQSLTLPTKPYRLNIALGG